MNPQDDVQIDVVSVLLMAIGASVMVIALWIGLIKTGVVM